MSYVCAAYISNFNSKIQNIIIRWPAGWLWALRATRGYWIQNCSGIGRFALADAVPDIEWFIGRLEGWLGNEFFILVAHEISWLMFETCFVLISISSRNAELFSAILMRNILFYLYQQPQGLAARPTFSKWYLLTCRMNLTLTPI